MGGKVNIISNSDCVADYDYTAQHIDASMICAQGKSGSNIVDACQGDSSGPLVCNAGGSWRVYGATSWGFGCAGAVYPGIWANVHNELQWIDDVLAGKVEPPSSGRRR